VHDLVAEHAPGATEALRDHGGGSSETLLRSAVIGEELAEGSQGGGGEAARAEVLERAAEIGIVPRSEQQVEDPAWRTVLTDLLGKGVLVEVDEHEDAVALAQHDHCRDAREIAAVVPTRRRLERAPADRKPQQVEAETAHALGIAGVEHGDGFEGQAA